MVGRRPDSDRATWIALAAGASLGGWLGGVMIGRGGGVLGGLWGGLLAVGAATLARRPWPVSLRWLAVVALVAGGFLLFWMAGGFAAATLGLLRAAGG